MDLDQISVIVASDINEGDWIVNIGTVVAKPKQAGVFILVEVRREVWSLVTGMRDSNHETIVLHCADGILVLRK